MRMKKVDVNKWAKEIVGFPTYLFAGIIGLLLSDGNILILFLFMIIAAAIYNTVYTKIFPDFDISGKRNILLVFFFSQIITISLILLLLYIY